jgi:hypothetical protein
VDAFKPAVVTSEHLIIEQVLDHWKAKTLEEMRGIQLLKAGDNFFLSEEQLYSSSLPCCSQQHQPPGLPASSWPALKCICCDPSGDLPSLPDQGSENVSVARFQQAAVTNQLLPFQLLKVMHACASNP